MVAPQISGLSDAGADGVLAFEFASPAGPVDERVILGADGRVSRVVQRAAGERPEVGWWTGELDASVLELAVDLASRSWSSAPTVGSQPAAGAWRAGATGQSIGLWGEADEVRGPLQSVLGACLTAASAALAVAEFHAHSTGTGSDEMPMLHVTSIGDAPVVVEFEIEGAEGSAAFLTADATTVGFLGFALVIEPGVEVFAALGVPSGHTTLVVDGSLRSESFNDLPIKVDVLIAR